MKLLGTGGMKREHRGDERRKGPGHLWLIMEVEMYFFFFCGASACPVCVQKMSCKKVCIRIFFQAIKCLKKMSCKIHSGPN